MSNVPAPPQQVVSHPEAKMGPPPAYVLAQQHPAYGYDQPGVTGGQNQVQMQAGTISTPAAPRTVIVTRRVYYRRPVFWGVIFGVKIAILVIILIAWRVAWADDSDSDDYYG